MEASGRGEGCCVSHQPERDVAAAYGLSHRTLRYWRQRGLISPLAATDREGCLYRTGDEQAVLGIIQAKQFGLSLAEIKRAAT